MATKASKEVAQSKPVVRFYVAEDLREEVGNRVSAIGLFPDNVMVVNIPDEMASPSEENPLLVKSLAFLFNISKVTHKTTVSVDVETNGKRRNFMVEKSFVAPGEGKSFNLVALMQPCPITSFGAKTFFVKVGASVHTFNLEIRREPLAVDEKSSQQKTTEPKKEAKPAVTKK